MENLFVQLSLILLIVLGVSLLMRILKQPLMIGYILSGILIGPFIFNLLPKTDVINVFSEFGIAFLLFIVGLHLSPKVFKEVGKVSLLTGIGQVIFTSIIGYFIGILLGFTPIVSLYIAIALTFSSTIIIMKLLSDKEAFEKLYGKISIGFLLVQDLIAIIILIVVSSFSQKAGVSGIGIIFSTFIKGIFLVLILVPLSRYILPRLNKFFAKSQELLFVFSIAWGLGLASLFFFMGFSIEIGALVAGIILSVSPYNYEISSKLKPLRDFFIISFFLILGYQMVFSDIHNFIVPAIIFSLFILIGNPLIVMILMGLLNYSKRTGFMAGLTVAQISEFSLILIALGTKVGHLPKEILPFVTMVGLATIAGSTYMIMYSEKIYPHISKYLSIFERKNIKEKKMKNKNFEYFLFGYNRIGFSILRALSRITKKYLIVDFNPEIIKALSSRKINYIYGDIEDVEFLQELRLRNAKMIISTIPDFEINMLLIETVRQINPNAIIIVRAHQIDDALELYKKGASYVLTPHFLGGEYVAKMVKELKTNQKEYREEKEKHIKMLTEMLSKGHEHPKIEKS